MLSRVKNRKRKKGDSEEIDDAGFEISNEQMCSEPMDVKISQVVINKTKTKIRHKKRRFRNTVRVDTTEEIRVDFSLKDVELGKLIVHLFFSNNAGKQEIGKWTCSLQFKQKKGTLKNSMGSSNTSWFDYFRDVPIYSLLGRVDFPCGVELILPANFSSSSCSIKITPPQNILNINQEPNQPTFSFTSFSCFCLGFNTMIKRLEFSKLLENQFISSRIISTLQEDGILPERLSLLLMVELLLSHFLVRREDFEDQYMQNIKPREFILHNIIAVKFPVVAQIADRIIKRILLAPEYFEAFHASFMDAVISLFAELPKSSSTECVDIFFSIMEFCFEMDPQRITQEIITQFQRTSKNMYENQISHYSILAEWHEDNVEDFPLDLNYLPPVYVGSNSFTSFNQTLYYDPNSISDIQFDFQWGEPLAVYRVNVFSTFGETFDNKNMLIIMYYWPANSEFKQEPRFLGMERGSGKEIAITREQQILCHGIRVIVSPLYPTYRGIGGSEKKSKEYTYKIQTVLQVFGENPYIVPNTIAIFRSRAVQQRELYKQIHQELLSMLQQGHTSVGESTIQRLRETRLQYMQERDTTFRLIALSKLLDNEDFPHEFKEIKIGVAHWALLAKRIADTIQKFHHFTVSIDQLALKTMFHHITGIFTPPVRIECARALTLLIVHSQTWKTWVIDIFIEYFANNSHRAFRTVPKKLVLSMLQEMIPFSASTTAAGQIYSLMEATLVASSLDCELLGWLLLASDNQLLQFDATETHVGSVCMNCDVRPIFGARFRCVYCIDYDLCLNCEPKSKDIHNPKHEFVVIKVPLPPYSHKIQSGSDFHITPILRIPGGEENATVINGEDTLLFNRSTSSSSLTHRSLDLVHQFTVCNECGIAPIIGVRYNCLFCMNFDYCERCFLTQSHIENHLFVKKKSIQPSGSVSLSHPECLVTPKHPSFYPRNVRIGTVSVTHRTDNIAMKHLVKRNRNRGQSKASYIFPANIAWDEERTGNLRVYQENPLGTLIKILSVCILSQEHIFQLGIGILQRLAKQNSIDVTVEEIIHHPAFYDLLSDSYRCETFSQASFLSTFDLLLQRDFYSTQSLNFKKQSEKAKEFIISHTKQILSLTRTPKQVEYGLDLLSLALRVDSFPDVLPTPLPNNRFTTTTKPKTTRPSPSIISGLTTSPVPSAGIRVTRTKAFAVKPIDDIPTNIISTPSQENLVRSNNSVVNNLHQKISSTEPSTSILGTLERMEIRRRNRPILSSLIDFLLEILEKYPLRSTTIQLWNRALHLISRGDPSYLADSILLQRFLSQLVDSAKINGNYRVLADAFRNIHQIILNNHSSSPTIYLMYVHSAIQLLLDLGNDDPEFVEILFSVLYEHFVLHVHEFPAEEAELLFTGLSTYIQTSSPSPVLIDIAADILHDFLNNHTSLLKIFLDKPKWNLIFDYVDKNSISAESKSSHSSEFIHSSYDKLWQFIRTLLHVTHQSSLFFLELLFDRTRLRSSPGKQTSTCFINLLRVKEIADDFVQNQGHEYLLRLLVGERGNRKKEDALIDVLLSSLQPGPSPIFDDSSHLENLNNAAKVIACSSDSLLSNNSIFHFREPYRLTCQFPYSVMLKRVVVSTYLEFHEHPPKSITVSTCTSELSSLEFTHQFQFGTPSSNATFYFDIPSSRPCFFVTITITPTQGSMQLCNITLQGQTLRTQQHVQSSTTRTNHFSLAKTLMDGLLSNDSHGIIIARDFSKQPALQQLLQLCFSLQDDMEEFIISLARFNSTIANEIIIYILQLPNKTCNHATLVEKLCSIKGHQEQRMLLLRDFVFSQLQQFDVIPFIDSLCASLHSQALKIHDEQMDLLFSHARDASVSSQTYDRSISLLCCILSFQPDYFKTFLDEFMEVYSKPAKKMISLDLHIPRTQSELMIIGTCCNASSSCATAVVESPLLSTLFDIFVSSCNKTCNWKESRRSSIGVFLSMPSDPTKNHNRKVANRPARQERNANSDLSQLPNPFLHASNFFLQSSYNTIIQKWGIQQLLPQCLTFLHIGMPKIYTQRISHIIENYANGCEENIQWLGKEALKIIERLYYAKDFDMKFLLKGLEELTHFLFIQNYISCSLVKRVTPQSWPLDGRIDQETSIHSSNFDFMHRMITSSNNDTFTIKKNVISTRCEPSLRTVIHPDALSLPFAIEMKIHSTSDILAMNNIFIGFVGGRKDQEYKKMALSYANRAIGNTGFSVAFSGTSIFQLGNSFVSKSHHAPFAVGDIIRASMDAEGNISFSMNGKHVTCNTTAPSFFLPLESGCQFYFGISIYNVKLTASLRIVPTFQSSFTPTPMFDSFALKEDHSSLKHLRVHPMYRVPASTPLYELLPFVVESQSIPSHLTIRFHLPDTCNDPLPLYLSLFQLGNMVRDTSKGIVDLEYSCVLRGEYEGLEHEMEDVRHVHVPNTSYMVVSALQKEVHGFNKLITLLLRLTEYLFRPEHVESLHILYYMRQLSTFLPIATFQHFFIASRDCMRDFEYVVLWNVQYATSHTDSNSKGKYEKKGEEKQGKFLFPLYSVLIHVFNQAGSSSSSSSRIREEFIEKEGVQSIFSFLEQCEGIAPRVPSGFNEDLFEKARLMKKPKDKLNKSKSHWAKGTGFGNENNARTDWMPHTFVARAKEKATIVARCFDVFTAFITAPGGSLPSTSFSKLHSSCLIPLLESYLRNTSMMDIMNTVGLYHSIFALLRAISSHSLLFPLLLPLHGKTSSILSLMQIMNENQQVGLATSSLEDKGAKNAILFAEDVSLTLKHILRGMKRKKNHKKSSSTPSTPTLAKEKKRKKKKLLSSSQIHSDYQNKLQSFQYNEMVDLGLCKTFTYHDKAFLSATASNATRRRLMNEMASLSSLGTLPLHWNSSVFLCIDPSNICVMQALITGPGNTPYANGCFLFDVFCGNSYPHVPPLVNLQTTGLGRVRFNPNLYKCGKVCLSLLGTWKGAQNEQWNKDTSTLLQVFVSIQALIFVEHPYFNEPSLEKWIGTPMGWVSSRMYNENIKPETIRFAMVDMLRKPPRGFEEVIKIHFTLKKKEILKQVSKWEQEQVHKKASMRVAVSELREELAKL